MSTELPLIGCALTEDELARREARAAELRPAVRAVSAEGQNATIESGPELDQGLLDELIAAERECCSFFRFDWQPDERRLEIGIPEARFQPTLEALVDAIAGQR